MTMKKWNGSSFVDLTTAKKWNGSSWVDLTLAKRWNGSAWVDIPLPGGGGGSLAATITDGAPIGSVFLPHAGSPTFKTVTTNTTTVVPTGGTGPYTYSWARISGDSAVLVSSATAATVSFTANVPRNDSRSATWRCTVTDALAASTTVDAFPTLFYTTDV